MSTQPFLVLNVVDGIPGVIRSRDTWDEAVEIATVMAAEQCDMKREIIQEEIEKAAFFIGDGFSVHICQPEDD